MKVEKGTTPRRDPGEPVTDGLRALIEQCRPHRRELAKKGFDLAYFRGLSAQLAAFEELRNHRAAEVAGPSDAPLRRVVEKLVSDIARQPEGPWAKHLGRPVDVPSVDEAAEAIVTAWQDAALRRRAPVGINRDRIGALQALRARRLTALDALQSSRRRELSAELTRLELALAELDPTPRTPPDRLRRGSNLATNESPQTENAHEKAAPSSANAQPARPTRMKRTERKQPKKAEAARRPPPQRRGRRRRPGSVGSR